MNKFKMMIVIFLVCSFPYQISKAQVMAPDGTYVGGSTATMAPDGSYVGGSGSSMAPDGTYVGE